MAHDVPAIDQPESARVLDAPRLDVGFNACPAQPLKRGDQLIARIVAPGYDVYYLEQEWRNFWVESGKPELKNPDAAFIGFCKSRYKRQPKP
jgi:hypothetical protein